MMSGHAVDVNPNLRILAESLDADVIVILRE
jgi:hypothetical protein